MKFLQFLAVSFRSFASYLGDFDTSQSCGAAAGRSRYRFRAHLHTGDSGLYSRWQKRGHDRGQKAVEKSVRFFENRAENLVFPDVVPDACNLLSDIWSIAFVRAATSIGNRTSVFAHADADICDCGFCRHCR